MAWVGGWHHHAGPHACDYGNHDGECPWRVEHGDLSME